MSAEDHPNNRPFEELLAANPNLVVHRDAGGMFRMFKNLTSTVQTWMGVFVKHNQLLNEPLEILISGHRVNHIATPAFNPMTYISIKRPGGDQIETEVIYPKDESQRLDYAELLKDAMGGLEIFDAFAQLSPQERVKYADRVIDGMEELDTEEYGRLMRAIGETMPDFVEFMAETGLDARLMKGQPKLALMLMRRVKDLPITRVTINQ